MFPTKTLSAVVGLLVNLSVVVASSHGTPKGPRVKLEYATYVGKSLQNGVDQFLGMRYAAAPVGDLRWRAPAPPEKQGVELAQEVNDSAQDLEQDTDPAIVQELLYRNQRKRSIWSRRRLSLRQPMEAHRCYTRVKATSLGFYSRRR